jgi:hypothetical protein
VRNSPDVRDPEPFPRISQLLELIPASHSWYSSFFGDLVGSLMAGGLRCLCGRLWSSKSTVKDIDSIGITNNLRRRQKISE